MRPTASTTGSAMGWSWTGCAAESPSAPPLADRAPVASGPRDTALRGGPPGAVAWCLLFRLVTDYLVQILVVFKLVALTSCIVFLR